MRVKLKPGQAGTLSYYHRGILVKLKPGDIADCPRGVYERNAHRLEVLDDYLEALTSQQLDYETTDMAAGEGIHRGALDPVLDPVPEWPLKMSPGDYLKRHPSGPNAALAKECLTAMTVGKAVATVKGISDVRSD